jgi:hypothetical protein
VRALKYDTLFLCLFAALSVRAQNRKPGVYELTLTTTTSSPSAKVYPPRVSQVCLTQQMIDKYGAIVPDNLTRACQLTNIVKKPGGMSADIVCSGGINGKGAIDVNWNDSEHAKGVIHFSGTIHPRDADIKLEWSATTTSVYKGPDCSVLAPTPAHAPPANP